MTLQELAQRANKEINLWGPETDKIIFLLAGFLGFGNISFF